MPELGKSLAQARVARGLTLEDCERDTRISKRYLDALEREDWKVFPAPVYSRAFMRTYAQYLGLDPQALMKAMSARDEQQPEPATIKPLPEIKASPATGNINWPLAGGVAVFIAVIGAFVWLSARNDGDGANGLLAGGATPTAAAPLPTEGQGGGLQPATGRPVGEVEEGVVPDLNGVRVDDAIVALGEAEIDYVILETDTVDGTPNVVASQSPAPGTDADDETSVTLVVPRTNGG
jgi:transcriptional regulator with XRE-family HTH domain